MLNITKSNYQLHIPLAQNTRRELSTPLPSALAVSISQRCWLAARAHHERHRLIRCTASRDYCSPFRIEDGLEGLRL